jgi:hypothetical protein
MARARFTADFKWPARGPWHIAYKAGMELTVKREVLDAALAAGAAVDLDAAASTAVEDEPRSPETPSGT